jgi:hypothetical protein
MGGSRRTFTYTLTPGPEEVERVASQTKRILGWACDGDKRIECHDITGEALGVVTMNLTIIGRDQWWCRQLAQDLINLITWGLRNEVKTKLDLQSYRLEPHDNRGYDHGRTKRYRERAPRKARSPEETVTQPEPMDSTSDTATPHD